MATTEKMTSVGRSRRHGLPSVVKSWDLKLFAKFKDFCLCSTRVSSGYLYFSPQKRLPAYGVVLALKIREK